MHIRSGHDEDIQSINAFDVFDHDIASAITAGCCLVAQVQGRAVGYAVYATRGLIGKDFVKFLVVDEAHRRRGIALALLRGVEQTVVRGRLFISTEADNTPMLTLLQKEGWAAAGQIEGINTSIYAELFFYTDLPRPPV